MNERIEFGTRFAWSLCPHEQTKSVFGVTLPGLCIVAACIGAITGLALWTFCEPTEQAACIDAEEREEDTIFRPWLCEIYEPREETGEINWTDRRKCQGAEGATEARVARAIHEALNDAGHRRAKAAYFGGVERGPSFARVSAETRADLLDVARAAMRAMDRERKQAPRCFSCAGPVADLQCIECGLAQPEATKLAAAYDPSARGRSYAAGVLLRMVREHEEAAEVAAERASGRTGDVFVREELETAARLVAGEPDAWERRGWGSPYQWRWVNAREVSHDVRELARLVREFGAKDWHAEPWASAYREVWSAIEHEFGLDIDQCHGCGLWNAVTPSGEGGRRLACGNCREENDFNQARIIEELRAERRSMGFEWLSKDKWALRWKHLARTYKADYEHAFYLLGQAKQALIKERQRIPAIQYSGAGLSVYDDPRLVAGPVEDEFAHGLVATGALELAAPRLEGGELAAAILRDNAKARRAHHDEPTPEAPKLCGARHESGLVCERPQNHTDVRYIGHWADRPGGRMHWFVADGSIYAGGTTHQRGPRDTTEGPDVPTWTANEYDDETNLAWEWTRNRALGLTDKPTPEAPKFCGAEHETGLVCERAADVKHARHTGLTPDESIRRWFRRTGVLYNERFQPVEYPPGIFRASTKSWTPGQYRTKEQVGNAPTAAQAFTTTVAPKTETRADRPRSGLQGGDDSNSKGLVDYGLFCAKGGT